jgi:hypothetical protein
MTRYFLLTILLVAGLLLAGCDSADPISGDLGTGQAQVTVTGDITASFDTFATFTAGQDETGAAMLFMLGGSPDAPGYVQIIADMMPTTGTFTIGPQQGYDLGAFYIDTVDGSGAIGIISASGTLTITSVTATSVVGSITFSGPVRYEADVPDGQGSVQASFNATSGPIVP